MSDLTFNELKSAVLTILTPDSVRKFGDLRKRSTWEAAWLSLPLSAWSATDEDLAEMTVDNVDQVPFETDTLATPVTVPALTCSEVGSIAATTAVATAIVAADYGQLAWTKAKALWTVAEPVLYQGLFFTVVLAIFFYWVTASAAQKTYLALEWSILQLVQETSPNLVLVQNGWTVNTEEPLLLAPAS